MGRCYEFAVAVNEGCEHAMVVSSEGGACECPRCGSRCTGRFGACEAILAVPGRVPPTAPEWAVKPDVLPPPVTTNGHDRGGLPTAAAPMPSVHDIGAGPSEAPAGTAAGPPGEAADLGLAVAEISGALKEMHGGIQSLSVQLTRRDAELRTTFERLNDSYRYLAGEMSALSRRMGELNSQLSASRSVEGRRDDDHSDRPASRRRTGPGRAERGGDPSPPSAWPPSAGAAS